MTIWDVTEETPPKVLRGHRMVVFEVRWSPDGKCLASSEWDNMIRLWDPASGAILQVLQHPNDAENFFYGLAWSPDGQRLATGTYAQEKPGWNEASCGDDGAIMIWDLQSGEHFRTLRRDRPYERLNITEIRGLTAAQKDTLLALGASEEARNAGSGRV